MYNKTPHKLGTFAVAMISIAGIFSIRGLPTMAEYGFSLVTYYLLGAILFFIPSALICAELATGWPETGGMYVWVREAFGQRAGFLAIWLEWTNTIVSFPAMLSFAVGVLLVLIDPQLTQHKGLLVGLMLTVLWGMTLFNFLGIRTSLLSSSWSTIIGIVLPATAIAALGLFWLILGKPAHVHFNTSKLLPDLHWNNAAFLAGMILNYAGMQVAGYHAQDLDDPQRSFPRAVFIAAALIVLLSILGALAVAIVIPQQNISLVTGLMQVVETFFHAFHLAWLAPIIGMMILIGFLASFNVWLISPSRGLAVCANESSWLKWLHQTDVHDVPIRILLLQAVVGSILALIFVFLPDINASYWLLTALTAQLTFLMDFLLFGSIIRLRYTHPHIDRRYQIPGGKLGIWLIAGVTLLVVAFGFIVGFIPPDQIKTGNSAFYDIFLVSGIVILSLPAFFIKPRPDIS